MDRLKKVILVVGVATPLFGALISFDVKTAFASTPSSTLLSVDSDALAPEDKLVKAKDDLVKALDLSLKKVDSLKTRLDELPQFLNILAGTMSFVGPRPERPEFVKELGKKIPYYNMRHLVRPGLTGWAQINFEYGDSIEDARIKLQYDIYYAKKRSIALDVAIILKTIRTVITRQGQ